MVVLQHQHARCRAGSPRSFAGGRDAIADGGDQGDVVGIGADQGGGGLAGPLVLLDCEVAVELPRLALAPDGGAAGLLRRERQGLQEAAFRKQTSRGMSKSARWEGSMQISTIGGGRLARLAVVRPDNFSGPPSLG